MGPTDACDTLSRLSERPRQGPRVIAASKISVSEMAMRPVGRASAADGALQLRVGLLNQRIAIPSVDHSQ